MNKAALITPEIADMMAAMVRNIGVLDPAGLVQVARRGFHQDMSNSPPGETRDILIRSAAALLLIAADAHAKLSGEAADAGPLPF